MIAVEIAGPHLPVTYTAVPDAIQSLASHVVNECVGRARRVGGFATMDIARLIDFVVDSSVDLDEYRKTATFFNVARFAPLVVLRLTFDSALVHLPHRQCHI